MDKAIEAARAALASSLCSRGAGVWDCERAKDGRVCSQCQWKRHLRALLSRLAEVEKERDEAREHLRLWVDAAEPVAKNYEAVVARADELTAVLHAERGQKGREGWRWQDECWVKGDADKGPWSFVGAPGIWGGPWRWEVTRPCGHPEHSDKPWPFVAAGEAASAWEAMRAADAALAGTADVRTGRAG